MCVQENEAHVLYEIVRASPQLKAIKFDGGAPSPSAEGEAARVPGDTIQLSPLIGADAVAELDLTGSFFFAHDRTCWTFDNAAYTEHERGPQLLFVAEAVARSPVLKKLNMDGHPLDIRQLKGDDPVEKINLDNKDLWLGSTVILPSSER